MTEFKPIKEGKVREIYDNGDSLIMVATDRISAFDVILKNKVTKKGTVLTQMSLTEIEQMYHEYFPTSLFSYFFLSDLNTFLYKSDRNFGWIFASASLIAIFVACLGLWIVTLFSTLSRLKEVGIRKVLGANKSSLFFILTKELMLLTILASAIGIPVSAVLMNGWLETYAFHISLPWWIYAVVFALLMLIAFLTVFQQVWRIICLKPMSILKYE